MTLPSWYFDKAPVQDADELIRRCGPAAFASPLRSTVPLLSLLKHDVGKFIEIACRRGVLTPGGLTGTGAQ